MAATPEVGYAEITFLDQYQQTAIYRFYLPTADFQTAGAAESKVLSLLNHLRDTSGTPVSLAQVRQVTLAQDHTFTDPAITTPTAGSPIVYEKGFFLGQTAGGRRAEIQVPGWNRSLLARSPRGKLDMIPHSAPVQTLVNAWTVGLAGIAPVAPNDQPLAVISVGTLRTRVGENG